MWLGTNRSIFLLIRITAEWGEFVRILRNPVCNSFTVRSASANLLNSLLNVIGTESVNSFRNRLDNYWE